MSEESGDPVRKRQDRAAVAVGITVVALCVGGVIIKSLAGSREPEDRSTPAVTACEGFVKDRLKAPATAKFSDERYGDDAGLFTVTGAVDAQNSFGAMIRNRFTCVVRDGGGDNWALRSLTGLD